MCARVSSAGISRIPCSACLFSRLSFVEKIALAAVLAMIQDVEVAPVVPIAAGLAVTQIEVSGMCCQSEVTLIQKKLSALDGIVDIKVNLMLRRIAVTHDRVKVEAERIIRVLNWSLLGASLVSEGGPTSKLRRGTLYTKETALLLVSFVLFAVAGGIWARPEGTPWYEDPFAYVGIACVAVGAPVLLSRALAGLVYNRTINMFCTMTIAVIGALALLDFWEAAAIVFFFVASEWLQAWCVHHTADMSTGLGGLLPEMVSPADGSPDKPLNLVELGELLRVKPGGAVPVDGDVTDGSSAVDESMLTGESMPVPKAAGSSVFAGTTNQTGVLTIRVNRLPADCSAAKLTAAVSEAQAAGSRELMLERFAKVYTLTILLAALLLATVPLGSCDDALSLFGGGDATATSATHGSDQGDHGGHAHHLDDRHGPQVCAWWLRRALALVVISCPCSLVVAMPVTYACGVSALSRWGVLVKSQSQMELLARLRTLCLDKTGTLTEGAFRLRQLIPNRTHPIVVGDDDAGIRKLIRLTAAVEASSLHPIAQAFLEYADSLGIEQQRLPSAHDFRILEGEGIAACVEGVTVHIGSERLARRVLAEAAAARGEEGPPPPEVERALLALEEACAAVEHAKREGIPRRMVASLEKKEAAAREAVEQAQASAMSSESAAISHLPSCKDPEACKGCAPKACCAYPCRRQARYGPCTGRCCHKGCGKHCNKPCEHTGPCPVGTNVPTVTAIASLFSSSPPRTSTKRRADLSLASPKVAAWSGGGASVLWILLDGEIAAACQLSDVIRSESRSAMSALKSLNVETTMLTGDAEATAKAVGAQAGIASYRAGMRPNEKLDAVRGHALNGVVGMLGDGVNDGPALAASDVGIAMGVGGTALASKAAGVVLMSNDLRRVADAVHGARLTTRVLRASVTSALLLKLLPLVLIFSLPEDAEGFLVASAVGSDLVGIVLVLAAAMSLLRAKARFAAAPCSNNDNSIEGPQVHGTATTHERA